MTSTQHWTDPLQCAVEKLRQRSSSVETVTLHLRLGKRHCNANDLRPRVLTAPHPRERLRLLLDRRLKLDVEQPLPGYVVSYEDRFDVLQRFGVLTPPLRVTERYCKNKRKRILRWLQRYDVFLCRDDFIPPNDVELFHELATETGKAYRIVTVAVAGTTENAPAVKSWLHNCRSRIFMQPHLTQCRRDVRVVLQPNKNPAALHYVRALNRANPTFNLRHSFLLPSEPGEQLGTWLQRVLCLKTREKQADVYADVLMLYSENISAPDMEFMQRFSAQCHTKIVFIDTRSRAARLESMNELRDVICFVAKQTTSVQYRPHVTAPLGTTSMSVEELTDNARVVLEHMYTRLDVLGWTKKLTMRVSATQSGSVPVEQQKNKVSEQE